MTITADYVPNIDLGNGATRIFAVNFPFNAASDLLVTLFDTVALANVSPSPILNGGGTFDYTVAGTPDPDTGIYPSGSITFNTAPLSNYKAVRQRLTAKRQSTALTSNGPFPAKTVEGALDREELQLQEQADSASRGLSAPASDGAITMTLPPKASRAGYLVVFDSNGKPINSTFTAAQYDASPAAAASAVAAAASAATSTAQAVIATTQAGIATTQAGNASASAGSASSSATTSSAAATTSTAQAVIATTQAGIATTQAGNASGSATSAAASAAAAASSANVYRTVRLVRDTNITVASALINGATIDGVTVTTGDRVLLAAQTTATENGIYDVAASGAASRSADSNTSGTMPPGLQVVVNEGTNHPDTTWMLTTNGPITLGTTSLAFAPKIGPVINFTASASASIPFTLSPAYKYYEIDLVDVVLTGTANLNFQTSQDGGATFQAANYTTGLSGLDTSSNAAFLVSNNSTIGVLIANSAKAAASAPIEGTIRLHNPASTTVTKQISVLNASFVDNASSDACQTSGGGRYTVGTAAYNAGRIIPSTSTIASGTIRVRGIP
jgi:hypothetical protein